MRLSLLSATLLSASTLFFSTVLCAQQTGEENSYTPPASLGEREQSSRTPEQQVRNPSTTSSPATATEASDEQQTPRAAESAKESIPLATSKPAQQQTLLSSSALVGNVVKNPQGEKLGDIRELMIDPQSGRVVYAVLGSGGVLGMGEKSLAIPWETLKVGLNQSELVVEVDKDKLQTVPSYEMSQR